MFFSTAKCLSEDSVLEKKVIGRSDWVRVAAIMLSQVTVSTQKAMSSSTAVTTELAICFKSFKCTFDIWRKWEWIVLNERHFLLRKHGYSLGIVGKHAHCTSQWCGIGWNRRSSKCHILDLVCTSFWIWSYSLLWNSVVKEISCCSRKTLFNSFS